MVSGLLACDWYMHVVGTCMYMHVVGKCMFGICLWLQGLFTTLQKEDSKVLAEILEVFDWLNKREDWDGLFTNRTVSELLWGYKDPILEKLHTWHNLSRFTHFVPDQNPVFAFAVRSQYSQ